MLFRRNAQQVTEPHRTDEAYALRRRLSAQFDQAVVSDEKALANAAAMVEALRRDRRYTTAPVR